MPFPSELREKLLLWSDRHCCLCKKACDVFITVHHIIPEAEGSHGGINNEDNAIPLCFECHGRVGHYNSEHPIGTMFKPEELKKRRDQIYEEFTRHLVPALSYRVLQSNQSVRRTLPDVGFSISHPGDTPPVKLLVTLDTYINGTIDTVDDIYSMYRGGIMWNLNPKEGVHGHFPVPNAACQVNADVRVGVRIVIYDCYERPHKLLPVTYVYDRENNEWWLDPIDPDESARHALRALQQGTPTSFSGHGATGPAG